MSWQKLHSRLCSPIQNLSSFKLLTTFCQGLETSLGLHLSTYDDTIWLERFIQLSNRVTNRVKGCMEDNQYQKPPLYHQPEDPSSPESMQINHTNLFLAEHQRWLTQGLCLYCGQSGYILQTCPIHLPRPMVNAFSHSPVNIHPFTTMVQLTTPHHSVTIQLWVSCQLHL